MARPANRSLRNLAFLEMNTPGSTTGAAAGKRGPGKAGGAGAAGSVALATVLLMFRALNRSARKAGGGGLTAGAAAGAGAANGLNRARSDRPP